MSSCSSTTKEEEVRKKPLLYWEIPYNTIDEAAWAASDYIYDISHSSGYEYAVVIYQSDTDGKYYLYNKYKDNHSNFVYFKKSGARYHGEIVAFVHTHLIESTPKLSLEDKDIAWKNDVIVYAVQPDKTMYKYATEYSSIVEVYRD